jgi:hypothetical protein
MKSKLRGAAGITCIITAYLLFPLTIQPDSLVRIEVKLTNISVWKPGVTFFNFTIVFQNRGIWPIQISDIREELYISTVGAGSFRGMGGLLPRPEPTMIPPLFSSSISGVLIHGLEEDLFWAAARGLDARILWFTVRIQGKFAMFGLHSFAKLFEFAGRVDVSAQGSSMVVRGLCMACMKPTRIEPTSSRLTSARAFFTFIRSAPIFMCA